MPSLENLHQYFKGKPFAIIAIDLEEKRETVLKSVRSHGLTYLNLLDTDGKTGALYGVNSTPTKYLIDAEGNMTGAALGYKEWDNEEIKSLIQTMIESGQT